MDTVKKFFGGKSTTSSTVAATEKSESHVSSESKASTPEPPEPYTPAEKTAKKGVLEDVYPWIKFLPAPTLTPAHDMGEGYDEGEDGDLDKTVWRDPDQGSVIDTRGMAPKNIDDRGRIRAGCVDCDCDEFERSPKGAACHYCHCAPSSHEILWPPPQEENKPPSENEILEDAEETSDKEEEEEKERSKSPGKVKSFIANFRKKIKPKTTAEELEEAKERELEEIRKQMEEEVEAFQKKKKKEFEKLKEVWSEMYFKSLPQERCSSDKRGILRGRCRDCDCDGFESDLPASSSCAYCGCAPTYHVAKVDYFSEEPLVIYNDRYVNEKALKNWKRSGFLAERTSTPSTKEEEPKIELRSPSRTSSFDESEEQDDGEKEEATVKEIYPWIKDKKGKKSKRVEASGRRGRGQLQEMTAEIRKLRAEIDSTMFYDTEDSLQTAVQKVWDEHHKLVTRFEELLSEMNAETPVATPEPS